MLALAGLLLPYLQLESVRIDCEFEGWVYKRGQNRTSWKKRYLVLNGQTLLYFENIKSKVRARARRCAAPGERAHDRTRVLCVPGRCCAQKPKGLIDVRGYYVEVVTTGDKPFAFSLVHPDRRNWFFYCKSEAEFGTWLRKLRVAVCAEKIDIFAMDSPPADHVRDFVYTILKTTLKARNVELSNLVEDVRDGVALLHFMEIVTSITVDSFHAEPKSRQQMLENISTALRMMDNLHVVRDREQVSEFAIADGTVSETALISLLFALVKVLRKKKKITVEAMLGSRAALYRARRADATNAARLVATGSLLDLPPQPGAEDLAAGKAEAELEADTSAYLTQNYASIGAALGQDAISVCLVGPAESGKTALLQRWASNSFVEKHVATIEDFVTKTVIVDGNVADLELLDTGGLLNSALLATLRKSQVFLFVFSLTSHASFVALGDMIDSVYKAYDTMPLGVVVGTHLDQAEAGARAQSAVTTRLFAESLDMPYCEVSAATGAHVRDVFAWAVRLANGAAQRTWIESPEYYDPVPQEALELPSTETIVFRPHEDFAFPAIAFGTLSEICAHMAHPDYCNMGFAAAMLLSHHYFTSSAALLDGLLARFREFHQSPDDQRVVQVRVWRCIMMWTRDYAHEFTGNKPLMAGLASLAKTMRKLPGMRFPYKLLKARLSELEADGKRRSRKVSTSMESPSGVAARQQRRSIALLSSRAVADEAMSVGVIDWQALGAQVFAQHLAWLHQQLFCKVTTSDLFELRLGAGGRGKQGAPIAVLTEQFNKLSSWVACEAVKPYVRVYRADVLSRFIDLAQQLLGLSDYHGALAVVSGLTMSPVQRMKASWALVPPSQLAAFSRLKTVLSGRAAFSTMRARLARTNDPTVPYIGMYLADITFFCEGNPDREGVVNVFKYEAVASVVLQLLRYQAPTRRYKFSLDNSLCEFCERLNGIDEDGLYTLSLYNEPLREDEGWTKRLTRPTPLSEVAESAFLQLVVGQLTTYVVRLREKLAIARQAKPDRMDPKMERMLQQVYQLLHDPFNAAISAMMGEFNLSELLHSAEPERAGPVADTDEEEEHGVAGAASDSEDDARHVDELPADHPLRLRLAARAEAGSLLDDVLLGPGPADARATKRLSALPKTDSADSLSSGAAHGVSPPLGGSSVLSPRSSLVLSASPLAPSAVASAAAAASDDSDDSDSSSTSGPAAK